MGSLKGDCKMKTVKGKKYKVNFDPCKFFKPGDIVIALEEDRVPFCVLEKDYEPPFKNVGHYLPSQWNAIKAIYLEEV